MILADTALSHTETRLVAVTAAYHEAERQFDLASADCLEYGRRHFDPRIIVVPGKGIISKINAMSMDVERSRLEAVRQQARERRNDLLAERASLLKSLGDVK